MTVQFGQTLMKRVAEGNCNMKAVLEGTNVDADQAKELREKLEQEAKQHRVEHFSSWHCYRCKTVNDKSEIVCNDCQSQNVLAVRQLGPDSNAREEAEEQVDWQVFVFTSVDLSSCSLMFFLVLLLHQK